jgi:signal peptidase I
VTPSRGEHSGGWWRGLRQIAVIIALVLVLRWAGFDQFKIPSGSMEPTLHGDPRFMRGDRVSVNKFVYGLRWPLNHFRIPFTSATIEYADRRILPGADPERWDIAVFYSPEPDEAGKVLIKRVVGLPGERVQLRDGAVYIDGERVEPPPDLRDILHYTTAPSDYEVRRVLLMMAARGAPLPFMSTRYDHGAITRGMATLRERTARTDPMLLSDEQVAALFEDLPGDLMPFGRQMLDASPEAQARYRYGIRPEDAYAVVPAGHYLMLGDNSAQSRDGRAFGWVPDEHILGRTFAIWWPPGRWRDFTGFSQTWWGRLLLYGVPLALILYELGRTFVLQSWRVAGRVADDSPVSPGEHVLVNLTAFGVRVPLARGRITAGRPPRARESVIYEDPDEAGGVLLGRVVALPGEETPEGRPVPDAAVAVTDGRPDVRVHVIPRERLVGVPVAVWWPLGNARRVGPASQQRKENPDGA